MLHDRVDIHWHIARIGFPRKEQQVTDDANSSISFTLDETHRLELLALKSVLQQELRERRDACKRVIELVRDTRDQLSNRGKFFSAAEVVGNLALLSEIPNADDQANHLIIRIADMAE